MRVVLLVVAALALAGCQSDGSPSALWGSAIGGFARGYGDGSATVQQPQRAAPQPMQVAPQVVAPAAQASFTGRATQVRTVTGGMAWECTYNYGGRDFVLLFENFCPPTAAIR